MAKKKKNLRRPLLVSTFLLSMGYLFFWVLQNLRPVPTSTYSPKKFGEKSFLRKKQKTPALQEKIQIEIGEQSQSFFTVFFDHTPRQYPFRKKQSEEEIRLEVGSFYQDFQQWFQRMKNQPHIQQVQVHLRLHPRSSLALLQLLETFLKQQGFFLSRLVAKERTTREKVYLWERKGEDGGS